MSRFPRLCLAGIALLIALNFAVGTGLVPGWGYWYSDDIDYRHQTDAFLEGSVALGSNPAKLDWDWAWWDGASQQVWGLGVPAWRLPFEAVARLLGYSAFPDRIAFIVALFTTTYVVLGIFLPRRFLSHPFRSIRDRPATVIAPLLLILSPAFVNLCCTRFWVYEEAQAYAYLAAIGILAVTISFTTNPTLFRFLLLAFMAGLAGFVRPTLISYGAASLIIALVRAYSCRWSPARLLTGIATFCVGCALLAATNYLRFGAIAEFGHGINLNDDDRMRFASRFDHPFAYEPFGSAASELFCSLFSSGNSFNGDDWYADRFFPGQSSTLRWREFYFTTFGLDTFFIVAGAWSWLMKRLVNGSWKGFWRPARTTPLVLALWSCLSAAPLWLFYLRCPFLASRYLVDFGPAIASGMVAASFAIREVLPAQWSRRVAYSLALTGTVGASWCATMLTSRVLVDDDLFPRSTALTQETLTQRKGTRSIAIPRLPQAYEMGMNLGTFRFNGDGWESETGRTRASAAFFIADTDTVELEVAADANQPLAEMSTIRARIGPEELVLQSNAVKDNGRLLKFRRPSSGRRLIGIQVLFVGLVTPAELHREHSRFRILSVRWHTSE
jgi:hypothetical protein